MVNLDHVETHLKDAQSTTVAVFLTLRDLVILTDCIISLVLILFQSKYIFLRSISEIAYMGMVVGGLDGGGTEDINGHLSNHLPYGGKCITVREVSENK